TTVAGSGGVEASSARGSTSSGSGRGGQPGSSHTRRPGARGAPATGHRYGSAAVPDPSGADSENPLSNAATGPSTSRTTSHSRSRSASQSSIAAETIAGLPLNRSPRASRGPVPSQPTRAS